MQGLWNKASYLGVNPLQPDEVKTAIIMNNWHNMLFDPFIEYQLDVPHRFNHFTMVFPDIGFGTWGADIVFVTLYFKQTNYESEQTAHALNIELEAGDCVYTFSDGYRDQFGGPRKRKYMMKRLKDKLLEIHAKPMAEQQDILRRELEEWRGEVPQLDDVLLIGIRI